MIELYEGIAADDVWGAAAESFRTGQWTAQEGRTGKTWEQLHAVFAIRDPRQRWVGSRLPAVNPAFALAEVVWILAGRNDARFPVHWNPMLPEFQGSGETFAGAYGHRLRAARGFDQVESAADALASNPDSRQVVLQIWDAATDMPTATGAPRAEDIPCNVMSLLKVRNNRLDWSQIVRSNDLFLGVPHNFVQFTTIQEILAGWLGVELGTYVHYSDSLHVYEAHATSVREHRPIPLPTNTDSLGLSRSEFREVFADLHDRAERLTHDSLTRVELMTLVAAADLPAPYENWMTVLGADIARRNGWVDECEQCAGRCTNDLLRTMWDRWMLRMRTAKGA